MENPPHIYVIGAGLIGLSTADSLTRRGARVTVLDKRDGPGQGASFANSGMIHPSQAWPWLKGDYLTEARQVYSLAQRSRSLLKNRMIALGLPDATRPNGCVQLFDSIVQGESIRDVHDLLGDDCEVVSGGPYTYGRYALKYPGDGSGNPYSFCRALEEDLIRSGVTFKYGVSDTDIDLLLAGAAPLVIAAGLGSVALCEKLGIVLPLYAERGFALNFNKPDIDLPEMPIMHYGTRSALTVFDDHVRLSGTIGENGPEALLDIWEEIAPDTIETLGEPILSWQDDRPMSKFGRPIISALKDNIWVNAGHCHMGWTTCCASGELMAEMILDGQGAPAFSLMQLDIS